MSSSRALLLTIALVGCRGEEVVPTGADSATSETAASDSANSETGGVDANDAGDAGDAVVAGCARAHGPKMVRIDATAASYCIDTTEVSVGHFNEFLSASAYDAPAFCKSFADARPPRNDTAAEQALPVRSVQWCWAQAYCKWAGKRLCGKIGSSGYDVPSDGRGEWTYACQNGKLATRYPYGATYIESTCNTAPGTLQSVGANKDCHGQGTPFDQVSDMLGNVGEIEGGVGFLTTGEPSSARGRGYAHGDGAHDCLDLADFAFTATYPQLGFRCCADP